MTSLVLGFGLGVLMINKDVAQAQSATPVPFLYPPFLGDALYASSIFDHSAPTYSGGQNDVHRITTFNGTVVYCATNTPTPVGFTGTPGPTPTPRCQSGSSYSGVSYDGHNGIDYVIRYQPVVAAADVEAVERAGWRSPTNRNFSYGLYVLLRHPNGYRTLYGHLSALNVYLCLTVGCSFSHGTVIGISGNTGSSSGPHLHFSVFNGEYIGTPDIQDSVIDPYGWVPTSAPVWANNQRNSLWIQPPFVGTNPAILPRGTALPQITQAPSQTVLDDSIATFTATGCTWTEINNSIATNGQMRYTIPINSGTAGCTVRWRPPTNLPRGVYQVWVKVPYVGLWTSDQYADGAIYEIKHYLETQPTVSANERVIVSQQEVVISGSWLNGQIYLGSYFFAGLGADEYILLSNLITGTVATDGRLVADSIILALERPVATPTPTRTSTNTPPPTPTWVFEPYQIQSRGVHSIQGVQTYHFDWNNPITSQKTFVGVIVDFVTVTGDPTKMRLWSVNSAPYWNANPNVSGSFWAAEVKPAYQGQKICVPVRDTATVSLVVQQEFSNWCVMGGYQISSVSANKLVTTSGPLRSDGTRSIGITANIDQTGQFEAYRFLGVNIAPILYGPPQTRNYLPIILKPIEPTATPTPGSGNRMPAPLPTDTPPPDGYPGLSTPTDVPIVTATITPTPTRTMTATRTTTFTKTPKPTRTPKP